MNKTPRMALLCAGPVSRSPLTHLSYLQRNLTWVKASSYQVASRAVNALGAGIPVTDFSEMSQASIWIVSVPASELRGVLEDLRAAKLEWKRRSLLILDCEAESDLAAGFRSAGAAVASFAPIDSEESRYVVEGDG